MTPPPSPTAHRLFAELVLLGITFIWGTTFVIVKDSLDDLGPHTLVAWRFMLGAVVVAAGNAITRRGQPRDPAGWKRALGPSSLLGLLLFTGFATQTTGLQDTTATQSAFITGTVTLWVPLMTWLCLGKRHGIDLWIAVPLGFAGLWLLTLKGGGAWLAWGRGEFLTLLCAFGFSGHIIMTQRWAPGIPTGRLAVIQLSVVAVLSLAAAAGSGEDLLPAAPWGAWLAVGYLALFPTALVFWAQARFQPLTTEERAAVIFLFEPVFAALIAWIVLHERLSPVQWGGALMITLSALAPAFVAFSRRRDSMAP